MIPFSGLNEMVALAARGVGKVDALGIRGITLVSMEEIAAMAGLLAAFGLIPVPPGSELADALNRGAI